jgi:pectin methylesterase-like acyl-CoA thioesterase
MIHLNALTSVPALLLAAAGLTCASTTVFNDTFSSGSTINSSVPSPAEPAVGAAAYQQLAGKAFNPNPPTLNPGALRFGMAATSSGFNSIAGLFTKYPLELVNDGDYLEMTVTFTTLGGINTSANSTLYFGLYNANQVQPKPGGMNNSTLLLAGHAAGWKGYVTRINYSGGSDGIFTRPAKLDTDSNNQDLLYNYGGGATVGTTTASTLAALVTGNSYTGVFRITKNSSSSLAITSNFYQGATPTGTPISSKSGTSTSILTSTFDGLALGWRATASVVSTMDVHSINIVTNALTTIVPVIEAAPLGQTRALGDDVSLTVVANGGGASGAELAYQWFKNNDPILLTENPTAQSATLSFPAAALSDSGDYKVTITNVAGSVTSTPVTLLITDGAIAPSIVTQPLGTSLLVGAPHTFTVLANGTAPLTYQWQFSADGGVNYVNLSGGDDSSFVISSATLADTGIYRCVVTNGEGSVASAGAVFTVNEVPAITAQPAGATLSPGAPLTLSVTASGTPAPTYQWRKNGQNILNATNSTYSVSSVTGADAGNYSVVVSNSVGTVTSALAPVVVFSGDFVPTVLTPVTTAAGLNPDTRLTLTFNSTVSPGVSGFLRIHDASNDAVVETIDFAAATTLRDTLRATSTLSTLNLPVQNQSIGGVTNFNYYPVTVSGNTVTIYPRNGSLTYNKSYYVKVDAGTFVNSSGVSFAGINDTSTWTFNTKAAGPDSQAALITIAADGSGDFNTLQGALDWVPSENLTPRTLFIKKGTYFEQIVFTNKHFLTLRGEDRSLSAIVYPNNNNFNNVSGFYHRSTFIANGARDLTVYNLTFHNTTPQGGSQAESFILNGGSAFNSRHIVTKCDFFSYQDTILIDRPTYISDCRIEGDTDFMWGRGPCFFENCDIKVLRTGAYFTQVRNGIENHGFVYNKCRLTAGAGFTGNYLGRIDPAVFPYSEVVLLDCSFGDAINNSFLNTSVGVSGSSYKAGWWLLNNNTTGTNTPNIRNWHNNIVDKDGVALNVGSGSVLSSMPTDEATQANYRNPVWVLNTTATGAASGSPVWTPALQPVFLAQPAGKTVTLGEAVTLQVEVAAVPAATYQWYLGETPIEGATAASYQIPGITTATLGSYKVVATNTAGSSQSLAAALVLDDPFNAYVGSFGLDPDTNGAPDVDYENDGLSNKLEFFLGGDPTKSEPGILPTARRESGPVFIVEFQRNTAAAGMDYVVEHSENLVDWLPAVHGVGGVTIETTSQDSARDRITVTLPATPASLYARLRLP